MKKVYLLFLFIHFLAISLNAETSFSKYNCSESMLKRAYKLRLMGNLEVSTVRSSAPLKQPVEVYQNQNNLDVVFLFHLGMINVIIYDIQGSTVFQASVNASANSHLYVPTRNLKKGVHRIYIVDTQGKYLEGEFKVE